MGGFRKFDKSRGSDSRGGGRSFGGNSGGGGRKFGGSSDGYRGDGQKPQMHAAVCSECDRDCQVPFRPSGGNPVFCSNCFKKQDSSAPRKSFGGDRGDRGGRSFGGDAGGASNMSKAQFDVLSMKLDKIMSLLKNVSEFDDEEEEYEEKKPRKFAGPTEQAPVRKSRGKRK